ncbi:MAG: DEAD/DEAH box helicase [Lysobacterales bacterium]
MDWQHFHPQVKAWFTQTYPAPTPAQAQAWPLIKQRQNVLIAAPTGSGKTLAAFLACIDDLAQDSQAGGLSEGVQVLYVSPLKALSGDISVNLEAPLAAISQRLTLGEPVRAGVRTGDTPVSEREKMKRRPPHILVTTPESLFILLTSESGRRMLGSVKQIIVDEIHALAGSKRGAHMLLSLARLDALTPRPAVRIGLSATQKPIESMTQFLCHGRPCSVVDAGHQRRRQLDLWAPPSPLTAIMSNEVWEEVYDHLAELIQRHKTTLIFVNTRRLAERATRHLAERLGEDEGGDRVMAHHGSLAKEHRHSAEQRLKAGELKAMVATASLELGIDIGDVDLVCQLSSPGSIASFVQRVGRSGHAVGAVPKGVLFPLSLDDLAECSALMHSVNHGELDKIRIPNHPLDVLAQHVVAETAAREWQADDLYDCLTHCCSYADLSREGFERVLQMLADGYSTRRGRQGAYLHYDRVHGALRPRRGARLTALTNAGTIPDLFDYQVVLRPADIPVGTLNEDFAFDSMPGDIFQLGNTSYRILKVQTGKVFVEDAHGLPPTVPFWFGEMPGRTDELSDAVSQMRQRANEFLAVGDPSALKQWLMSAVSLDESPAAQLTDYLDKSHAALGLLPNHSTMMLERFFDEVGDMHLVIHSTFGSRLNRALGLALRKKFCRKFNFELQASAVEDALILSLGPTHSFDMAEVLGYLKADSVRDVLIQALLDSPMFPTHWRWNACIALAVKRMFGGKKRPPQFQRNDAEDLMAVVFPDQLACAENLAGAREVPDHPLVDQTLDDCLTDVMDVDGLKALLTAVSQGDIGVECRELIHPSPLTEAVLNAKPYAFLDDGEAEDRRTRAVRTRPDLTVADAANLSRLDPKAIARVLQEVQPKVRDSDELHDLLLVGGVLNHTQLQAVDGAVWADQLFNAQRAMPFQAGNHTLWVARERLAEVCAAYGLENPVLTPLDVLPSADDGRVNVMRSALELTGPISEAQLAEQLRWTPSDVAVALAALEFEGVAIKGQFDGAGMLWCNRRLLARIHKYSLAFRRHQVRPVTMAMFTRFLFRWHDLIDPEGRGPGALERVVDKLQGCSAPGKELEKILASRLQSYRPGWLDELSRSGRYTWLRLTPSTEASAVGQTTPIALVARQSAHFWRSTSEQNCGVLSAPGQKVLQALGERGASFADELAPITQLSDSGIETALAELVAQGLVTSDSFQGARYLSLSQRQRHRLQRHRAGGLPVQGLAESGRWVRLPIVEGNENERWRRADHGARVLLNRFGVVFRALAHGRAELPPWRDLHYVLRRMEQSEEIAGGRFVDGVSGEQFALPAAVTALNQARSQSQLTPLVISACDPLNLTGRLFSAFQRVPAVAGNRVAFVDGEAVAALISGELVALAGDEPDAMLRHALVMGHAGQSPNGWSRKKTIGKSDAISCTAAMPVPYSLP